MAKKGLRDYPSWADNPFVLSKDKKWFKSTAQESKDFVDINTGEVIDTVHNMKVVDTKPFIKVFYENENFLLGLTKYGIRILHEILNDLKPLEDEVYLNANQLAKKYDLSDSRDIRLGIVELLEANVICRKVGVHNYFINVRVLFNGNRLKYNQGRVEPDETL